MNLVGKKISGKVCNFNTIQNKVVNNGTIISDTVDSICQKQLMEFTFTKKVCCNNYEGNLEMHTPNNQIIKMPIQLIRGMKKG